MRKILLVARREYRESIRSKAFIIGLLLGPIFMSGGAVIFLLFKDRVDTRDKVLAVVDRSGVVADAVVDAAERWNREGACDSETGKQVRPAYRIELVPPAEESLESQRLMLSDRVRRGELHAVIEIGPDVLHPRPESGRDALIAYYAKSAAIDRIRNWVSDTVNVKLREARLADAGIDQQSIPDLFYWVHAEPLGLVTADSETGEVKQGERQSELVTLLLPLAMPMMMFLLIMMGVMPLLTTVTEEKAQRIAEVMLGSMKPFHFMMGKLIGGACVSITAATVYVVVAIGCLHLMDVSEFIPYQLLPWFFVYMTMAIFMFGALFAALGSACNDASETQSVMMPAMLPVIFPFFVQMPVVTQPDSTFATFLSLFPTCTPMLMLIRLGTPGGVPAWQPWVGLLGVALTTVFFVWVAGRVFRVGILMSGTPPSWRSIVRWAIYERS